MASVDRDSQKKKFFILIASMGEAALKKGSHKRWHYLFSWIWRERGVFVVRLLGGRVGRELGFCACVRVRVRRRRNSKHFSSIRQTSRRGVKHFSSTTSNISAWRSARLGEMSGTFSINLPWRRLLCRTNERTNKRTNERTNAHFSKQFFKCFCIIWLSKLPVIYLMLILLVEISGRPIQF